MLDYIQLYYVQQIKSVYWIIGDASYAFLFNLLFLQVPLNGKTLRMAATRFMCSYVGLLVTASAYYALVRDDKYLFMVVYLIFAVGMAGAAREWKPTSRLVMASVYYVVHMYSLGVSQGLDFLRLSDENYPIVTTILRLLMVLLAVLFLRRFSVEEVSRVSLHTVLLIELSCLMTFLIFLHYTAVRLEGHSETDNLMMLIYVAFFVIVLTAYYMFRGIARSIEEIATLRNQKLLMELEAGRVEASESAMEETRRTRHDMKNHLQYMKSLLKEERYQDAKCYLEEVTDYVEQTLSYIDCGNKNVNAILNYEKGRAEKTGISLRLAVAVPETLPFLEMDMCSLLCNLLENAIEACESGRMVGAAVDLNMRLQGDYLLIRVVNPLPKSRKAQPSVNLETTKKNKENHGYGVKIIRSIAEKYGGYVKFKTEGQLFVADVMLDMKGGENIANRDM